MRREELYLADLIDNARAVRGYLDGVTRERWNAEDILRDAVLYRMLLLGEIASALPDDLRGRYPDVAWRQIRAFRNLAVHKYFGVDWAVVWKIAQEEPPLLERQVLAIISAEYPALAQSYDPGPVPDPGTASSLRAHGDAVDLGRNGNPCASYRLRARMDRQRRVIPPAACFVVDEMPCTASSARPPSWRRSCARGLLHS
jgi:uncharacterized protein with HEPN domain